MSFFHIHFFHPTRYNPYGIVTEQRCRCGLYQHHTVDDLRGVKMGAQPRWHEGPHPNRKGEPRCR